MHILWAVQSQLVSPGHMYRSPMPNGLGRCIHHVCIYLCCKYVYAYIYVTAMVKGENMKSVRGYRVLESGRVI